MPQEPIILVDSVTRLFGRVAAVRNLSLSVDRGQLVGFIGPSGSGKTTTLRMLCGILAPMEGKVRVFGKDPFHFGTRERARIGYLPQHFLLYPNLSVVANLSFMAGLYGMGLRTRGRRMRQILEMVEMWPERGKQASQLSGGMQRRLALSATLLHDPELLFLDEPTGGQDPILRRKIWEWLRRLGQEGRTLFVTTHYVGDAELCERVALMDSGRLIAFDTPASLRRRAFGGDLMELIVSRDIHAYLRTLERMRQVRAVEVRARDRLVLVVGDAGKDLVDIAAGLRAQSLPPDSLRETQPPFEDVFERLIRRHQRQGRRS
jgi:ABC-2 type transport system ATP-binding protein